VCYTLLLCVNKYWLGISNIYQYIVQCCVWYAGIMQILITSVKVAEQLTYGQNQI